MFTTEYVKNLYDNYLVLTVEGEESREAEFAYKMLAGNNIKGLLRCKKRTADMNNCYYYDISTGSAIGSTFEKNQLDEYQIQKIIVSILEAVDEARKYMLRDDGFILRPEYTYINVTSFEVNLCYLPGAGTDLKEELSVLLEFILERVDHNNDRAIVLSYGLYQIVKSDEVSFEKLTKFMDNTMQDPGCSKTLYDRPGDVVRAGKADGYDRNIEYHNGNDREYEREDEHEYDPEYGREYEEEDDTDQQNVTKTSIIPAGFKERYESLIPAAVCVLGLLAAAGILYLSGICVKDGKLNVPLWLIASLTTGSGLAAMVLFFMRTPHIRNMSAEADHTGTENNKDYDNEYRDSFDEEYEFPAEKPYLAYGEPESAKESVYDEDSEEKTVLLSDLRQTGFALTRTDGDIRTVKISGYPFVIGKVVDKVDLCLKEAAVSRFHAKIEKAPGDPPDAGIYLTDLRSTNGTYIDETRIEPDVPFNVHPGQRIRFGNVEYILVLQ